MNNPNNKLINWGLFFMLAVIWGSSFILMKWGMYGGEGKATLTAFQVAAIRILSAGLVLLPKGIIQFSKIPGDKKMFVILSGILGSFIPAFLFCIAETKIDSSLAGFLNALTPVFIIIIGAMFFHSPIQKNKAGGLVIAFTGMLILFLANKHLSLQYTGYAGFALLATICYGFNVNMVNRHLREIGSFNIAAVSLSALVLPSFLVLLLTGFFKLPLLNARFIYSTLSAMTLGILGTAVATILFYMLLKRAGPLFSSMVTYGIPFIALGWGLLYGESINAIQVVGLAIILSGVYFTNKS
jgi:drug/metabolite transporter (DMT)-like permease